MGGSEKGKVSGWEFKAAGQAVVESRRQEAAGRVITGLVVGFKKGKCWKGW